MTALILDTSFVKDLAEALQSANEDSYHEVVEYMCSSIRRASTELFFITSLAKDERRILPKNLTEFSNILLDKCRIRTPWLKRRKSIKVKRFEDILRNVCTEDIRSFVEQLVHRFANIRNLCSLHDDKATIRKVVDLDLHIVIAVIYFLFNCLDCIIFTSDKGLEQLMAVIKTDVQNLGHNIEVVYISRRV